MPAKFYQIRRINILCNNIRCNDPKDLEAFRKLLSKHLNKSAVSLTYNIVENEKAKDKR